jgi:hypothetical protein
VRISPALIGLLAAGVMTACSSSAAKGSDPYCQHLTTVSHRLAGAQQDLFTSGARNQGALSQIVGELQGLQKGAPAGISRALAELATAYQQAEAALQHPTKRAQQQLAHVAHVLSTDGKQVNEYVTSKCT